MNRPGKSPPWKGNVTCDEVKAGQIEKELYGGAKTVDSIDMENSMTIPFEERSVPEFYKMKATKFLDSLKHPENGIRGFLRPLPQDISKHIRGKVYKKYLNESAEYNYEFFYFTPVYDDVRYGAIIAVDKSKTNIPHTYRFYEIYGEESKALEWAMDFPNVIVVNTLVERRVELDYPEEIFSIDEIKQIVGDAVNTDEKLKLQILAQLLGASSINEFGSTSGTFMTLYPRGDDHNSLDIENIKRFISDLYFPFTVDFNRGKKEFSESCFYIRKKTEFSMPKTSLLLYTERKQEVAAFLKKRGTMNQIVDGVIYESDPSTGGPYNSRTEIPALLHKFDAELGDNKKILDEIRSSIMFHKIKTIEDRTELGTRVEVFDESLIELVKTETNEEEIVDFLTSRDTILDPNIGYGRYENTLRFSTAVNKEKGVLTSKGLQRPSKIIGQEIADVLNQLFKNPVEKDRIQREIEIRKRMPPAEAERYFIKVFNDTTRTYGPIIDFDILVKEYSKASGKDIEIAKEIVKRDANTSKNLGYIREVSPGKWMFTRWFEYSKKERF